MILDWNQGLTLNFPISMELLLETTHGWFLLMAIIIIQLCVCLLPFMELMVAQYCDNCSLNEELKINFNSASLAAIIGLSSFKCAYINFHFLLKIPTGRSCEEWKGDNSNTVPPPPRTTTATATATLVNTQ